MKIEITVARDTLSPDLAARLALASDLAPIHRAFGVGLVGITKRAFNDASLRAAPWPAKRDGSAATLRQSGTLAKSIRLISADASGLTLGSDRPYAAVHQLGGRTPAHIIRAKTKKALNIPGIGFRKSANHPGSNIPARPYFPVDSLGQLTPAAVAMLHDILERHLTP